MGEGNTLNENSSLQEPLNQLVNSEHWVKEIVAAYFGAKLEQVVIIVKEADR